MKILTLIKKLYFHLNSKHYRRLLILLLLMFLSAGAEVVSIGAVIPFLAVITSPEIVFTYKSLIPFLDYFSLSSPEQLIFPAVILFATAAIIAGCFRLALLWSQTRISFSIGVDLCVIAYRNTLYQPYEFHVSKNTSEIISGISIKTEAVANNTILPIVNILSSSLSLTAILVTLFIIDPIVAIVSIVGFGLVYCIVVLYCNRKLRNESSKINVEQNRVIKELQEGLGSIRDILIDGSQKIHAEVYRTSDTRLRRAMGNIGILSGAPKYFVEAVGIAIVAFIAYWMTQQPRDANENLIILGAFAMGAQRVLPMIQQIYVGITSILGNSAALGDVIFLLNQPIPLNKSFQKNPNFKFQSSVVFKDVSFRYKSRNNEVIKNFNFKVLKGKHIGIVGETGSGKSTFLDILMGLLHPQSGQFLVDGVIISDENKRSWQAILGHVPQNIYLTDSSILKNITINIPKNEIDQKRLKFAVEVSQLQSVIKNLPFGLETIIGERGGLLSGGQRQRIGIARALYKNPEILILDEATNALDVKTETNLIKALKLIKSNITVFMVAHRLKTLKNCDEIIKIEDGKIVRIAQYNDFSDNDA